MRHLLVLFLWISIFKAEAAHPVENIPVADLQQRVERASDTLFVVNLWATWCQPCVKEIPEFNRIAPQLEGVPVKVLMANLDFPNQKEARLLPFLEQHEVRHEVLMLLTPRGGDWIEALDPAWSGAIPATIMHYKGKRFFHEGEATYEQLEEWMKSLL